MTSRRNFFALAGTLGLAGAAGTAAATPAVARTARSASAVTPGIPFAENYAGKSGRLVRADSGNAYFYTGGLDFVACDGTLRLGSDSASRPLPAAAYQQVDLGAPIALIGAWFYLDATGGRTTHGSGILLGGFSDQLLDPTTISAAIHVVIGIDYWGYYILDHGTPVVLGNGPYAPLIPNQIYYTEVMVSGSTAALLTPDGATQTITDPRIATLGRSWLTTEVVLTSATDVEGVYTALQASI